MTKTDDIVSALSKVLASSEFEKSERSSALLSYIIAEYLEGRADRISGKTIAADVFLRGPDFDSNIDPIVRVQVGRMREALAQYYAGEGANDPLIITVPKGKYQPVFTPRETTTGKAPEASLAEESSQLLPRIPDWAIGTLVATAFMSVVAVVNLFSSSRTPDWPDYSRYTTVYVDQLENLTGEAENDIYELGIQQQLAVDLQRLQQLRITTRAPDDAEYYHLSGSILDVGESFDITLRLDDGITGQLEEAWRVNMNVNGDAYFDTLTTISQRASGQATQPHDSLQLSALRDLEDDIGLARFGRASAFECLTHFEIFVRAKTADNFSTAFTCLRGEMDQHPDDPNLLSAMSWMIALAAPEIHHVDVSDSAAPFTLERASLMAKRAVALDPRNDRAHIHLGLIEWLQGQDADALASFQRAIEANSGDPIHWAQTALFLSLVGDWNEALLLADRANDMHGNPPAWFRAPYVLRAILDADGITALEELQRTQTPNGPYYAVFLLVAASLAGDAQIVADARPIVLSHADAHAGDPLGGMRIWIRSPEILNALTQALEHEGIPVPA